MEHLFYILISASSIVTSQIANSYQWLLITLARTAGSRYQVWARIIVGRRHIDRKYYLPKIIFDECVPVATHWSKVDYFFHDVLTNVYQLQDIG